LILQHHCSADHSVRQTAHIGRKKQKTMENEFYIRHYLVRLSSSYPRRCGNQWGIRSLKPESEIKGPIVGKLAYLCATCSERYYGEMSCLLTCLPKMVLVINWAVHQFACLCRCFWWQSCFFWVESMLWPILFSS
jgi:hypothetical protein